MLRAKGKVVGNDGGRARIRFETSACGSCRGCRQGGPPQDINFAAIGPIHGDVGEQNIEATISRGALLRVLLHSMGFPLIGFIAGACIGLASGTNDVAAAALSLGGLAAGVLVCRQQQMDLIRISEVTNE